MKKRIIAYLLTIVLASWLLISVVIGGYSRLKIKKILNQNKEDIFQQIETSLQEYDTLLFSIEKQMETGGEKAISAIINDLDIQSKEDHFSSMQLKNIAKRYGASEIYLINKEGYIYNTSFEPDMQLNLFSLGDDFKNYLKSMFGTGVFHHQRITISAKTGAVNKYIYFSPKSADYILEISISLDDYIDTNYVPEFRNLLLSSSYKKIIKNNLYLNELDIYAVTNISAWSFITSKVPQEDKNFIDSVFSENEIQIRKGATITIYKNLEMQKLLPDKKHFFKNFNQIAKVEYDFSIFHKYTNTLIMFSTVSTLFIIIIIFLVSSKFLNTYLIERIIRINKGLSIIREGNYNVDIQVLGNDEISTIAENINKMAGGLKERERFQKSISIAKEVQQLLLPKQNPEISGLDIAGQSIYCEETGGDYYDFLDIGLQNSKRIGIVVGDVSGHGIGSALFMAMARSLLHLRSTQPGTLSEIINDVNHQLAIDLEDSGQFMTLFYLIVDQQAQSIKWVRAGHEPGIVYDRCDDSFDELRGTGIPLGVDADFKYAEEKTRIKKNQVVIIGTDGIWEATDANGKMFGKEPIYRIIKANATHESREILKAIMEELKHFHKDTNLADDITLVVIKT